MDDKTKILLEEIGGIGVMLLVLQEKLSSRLTELTQHLQQKEGDKKNG